MHPRTGKVADNSLFFRIQTEHDDDAARLVFAEKTACRPADHQKRDLFFVCFHMDTGTVSGVAAHKDLAPAHGIPCRVADAAVDNDPSGVHCVADSVLRVARDGDRAAVEIRAQRVAGDALDTDGFAGHAGADKPLPADARQRAVGCLLTQQRVDRAVIHFTYIDHYTTPPNDFFLFSEEKAAEVEVFFISSKSIVSRGVRLRISDVYSPARAVSLMSMNPCSRPSFV